ncbi:MAG: hypothetical protein PHW01_03020 [Patescibacteria group bacterium]|nr:hypothetical protein [Patescibacteria group bacterium]
MKAGIQKNILYTLTFFDLIGKPLTIFECWQYLFNVFPLKSGASIIEIESILRKHPKVANFRGFYFLKGHRGLVDRRRREHNFSQVKWKRARRAARLLSYVPFVRMVAVCNTVAFDTAGKGSDIDFLILVQNGKMWTTRFAVTFLVSFLGLRRHHRKIADRICLSFYLADNCLDLRRVALRKENGAINDPYLVYWTSKVSPVYDEGRGKSFLLQNNWMRKYLPNYIPYSGVGRRVIQNNLPKKIWKKSIEWLLCSIFGNLGEDILKKLQLAKMSHNTKSVAREQNTKVIISDQILKFHERDLRGFYQEGLDKKFNFAKII